MPPVLISATLGETRSKSIRGLCSRPFAPQNLASISIGMTHLKKFEWDNDFCRAQRYASPPKHHRLLHKTEEKEKSSLPFFHLWSVKDPGPLLNKSLPGDNMVPVRITWYLLEA